MTKWPTFDKIEIVILAAGKGQRFKDAGFKEPKPFIDLCGKTMLQRVIDNIGIKNANYHLVTNRVSPPKSKKYKTVITDSRDGVTGLYGSAAALSDWVNSSNDVIDPKNGIFVINCDQIIDDDAYVNALNLFQSYGSDFGVIACESDNPKWSHIWLDRAGRLDGFKEKSNIRWRGLIRDKSVLADVGAIYYKNLYTLVDSLTCVSVVNNELCHGSGVQHLIDRKDMCGHVYVTKKMINVGTIAGYKEYCAIHKAN